jgi:sugar phosphate isomerase/epimerase
MAGYSEYERKRDGRSYKRCTTAELRILLQEAHSLSRYGYSAGAEIRFQSGVDELKRLYREEHALGAQRVDEILAVLAERGDTAIAVPGRRRSAMDRMIDYDRAEIAGRKELAISISFMHSMGDQLDTAIGELEKVAGADGPRAHIITVRDMLDSFGNL